MIYSGGCACVVYRNALSLAAHQRTLSRFQKVVASTLISMKWTWHGRFIYTPEGITTCLVTTFLVSAVLRPRTDYVEMSSLFRKNITHISTLFPSLSISRDRRWNV